MNPEKDLIFTLFNVFVTGWIMPLFFVISGIATYFSLARRNTGQFIKSRFKRLIIPFIFALFLILPVDRYFEVLFNGSFTGSFTDFFPGFYITEAFTFSFNFSPTYFANSTQGLYLWYLFWLFVFSIIAVPFFNYLKKDEIKKKITSLANQCNKFGGIFLLAIPLISQSNFNSTLFCFPKLLWRMETAIVFSVLCTCLCDGFRYQI